MSAQILSQVREGDITHYTPGITMAYRCYYIGVESWEVG